MSGLVGIVSSKRDAPVSADEIDRLSLDYEQLRGAGARVAYSAGAFARVTQLLRAPPQETPPGAVADARAAGTGTRSSWVTSAGTMHDPHSTGGADLAQLDGQFAWVSYDASRDELSLASDPMGMQALYIARSAGKIFFSTCALALAKHLRAHPSRIGLAVFLRAGYQFGALTPWEGIERLDPGTRITFAPNGTVREVYWSPSLDEELAQMDMRGTVEHCTGVAVETFRAYLANRPRAWSDLTCGYDTRLLTLLLREAGVEFITNTVGPRSKQDVRVAEQISRIAGWEWHRYDIPHDWSPTLRELLPLAVGWGDCHLNAFQLAEVLWGHREKSRLHSRLFIGGGGEHFRLHASQQEFFNAGKSTRVNLDNWVDMVLLWPLDTAVFAEDPTSAVRADLRSRMAARAEPFSSCLNTVQLDILHAYKTTGHLGAYRSAAGAFLDAELPFYSKPVFNVALSSGFRLRKSHALVRHMICALDERVSVFPTTPGGPAQPMRLGNLHLFAPYYRNLARKATTKISQRLIGRSLLLREPAPDTVRSSARADVVNTLDDGRPLRAAAMRSARLYKADALDRLLARAGDPNLREAELLCRILTAELALRMVDGSVDE
jgi:Glutamine amidotransferase domain